MSHGRLALREDVVDPVRAWQLTVGVVRPGKEWRRGRVMARPPRWRLMGGPLHLRVHPPGAHLLPRSSQSGRYIGVTSGL
jgi:hypothetical protein